MPRTLGPHRQITRRLAPAMFAAAVLLGGCESGQPHNPHGMQGSIGGHGHSVGQRENQGPAVGSNPTVREDLDYFGSTGGVSRQ